MIDEFDCRQPPGQLFIGCMIMQILDLYLEGILLIPSPDLIAARINYICKKYNMTGSRKETFIHIEIAMD